MKLESVKCPNCGAALSAPNTDGGVICLFCGSLLQIVGAKLSQPKAQPAPIKPETGASSTQQAIDRLKHKLAELEAQEKQPVKTLATISHRDSHSGRLRGQLVLGIALLGFLSLVVDDPLILDILLVVAIILFSIIFIYALFLIYTLLAKRHKQEQAAARAALAQSRSQSILKKKRRIEGQIAALERDLDQLTHDL